jgi:hypothetical protein
LARADMLRPAHEVWWALSDPSQDDHGPPGSLPNSVRAPPSFS